MRIMCLAVLRKEFPQLLEKFDAQVRHLRNCNADTWGFALGPADPQDMSRYSFSYINVPFKRNICMAAAEALAHDCRPDVIYFRYPGATRYLRQFTRRHANVVFEHNTKEETEARGQKLLDERFWGARTLSLAAGLCGVTSEILTYEQGRLARPVNGMVLGNGIEPGKIPILSGQAPDQEIHLLCAARFAPWHGVDRLLRGMAGYCGEERFVLHLAGDGPEVSAYAELARSLSLESRVIMHGRLEPEALHRLAAQCSLGVGSLARHRTGMLEHAALKHREYCLLGLPFFFAGRDGDFDPLPPFALALPADDRPVDMEAVAALARLTRDRPALRSEMRRYGEERLAWSLKCGRLCDFLRECAQPARFSRLETPAAPYAAITPVIALNVGTATQGGDLAATLRSLPDLRSPDGKECGLVLAGPARHAGEALDACRTLGGRQGAAGFVPVEGDQWEAWNAGMAAAAGSWLLPLLAGDRLQCDLPEILYQSLRSRPELNMLTFETRDKHGQPWLPKGFCSFVPEMEGPPGGLIFRRSLWEDAGGYQRLHPLGLTDWLFWLACLDNGLLHSRAPGMCVVRSESSPWEKCRLPSEREAEAWAMLVTMRSRCFFPGTVRHFQRSLTRLENPDLPAVRAIAERHSDAAWPHLCLGLFHEGLGEFSEAEAAFHAAANLDPQDWQPWLRLYFIHCGLGRAKRAAEDKAACLERLDELSRYFARIESNGGAA